MKRWRENNCSELIEILALAVSKAVDGNVTIEMTNVRKHIQLITNGAEEVERRTIATTFNVICGTGRTAKMLRSKWDSPKKLSLGAKYIKLVAVHSQI
ncbi:hypothetical protein HUJ04_003154 [Dendroctonus ponderosae]|nr:hypothetical protein HUJ04_003154 [Dendroctonus ponderosae]